MLQCTKKMLLYQCIKKMFLYHTEKCMIPILQRVCRKLLSLGQQGLFSNPTQLFSLSYYLLPNCPALGHNLCVQLLPSSSHSLHITEAFEDVELPLKHVGKPHSCGKTFRKKHKFGHIYQFLFSLHLINVMAVRTYASINSD